MSPEDFFVYTRRRPFEPFRIVLTDGTSYEVRHSDMVLPARRTLAVGVPAEPGQTIADRIVTVSLLHVVRLESLDTAATA